MYGLDEVSKLSINANYTNEDFKKLRIKYEEELDRFINKKVCFNPSDKNIVDIEVDKDSKPKTENCSENYTLYSYYDIYNRKLELIKESLISYKEFIDKLILANDSNKLTPFNKTISLYENIKYNLNFISNNINRIKIMNVDSLVSSNSKILKGDDEDEFLLLMLIS